MSGTGRSTETVSNPSAWWMPSQTACRIASIANVSVSREDTRSSCSSAFRWRDDSADSWALWIASAACDASATSTSSSSSVGWRPDTGSSTAMIPSSGPSEWCSGTISASSGCQASCASLARQLGDV